jgi:hypothetical protein
MIAPFGHSVNYVGGVRQVRLGQVLLQYLKPGEFRKGLW